MEAQIRRAQAFKALHEREGAFVIPNPWDAGSAKMLASLGFEALATTSAGHAFSLARPDGALGLEDTLANVRAIVAAADLPVAVDLENGFADAPEDCARSLLRAAEAGAVGGSIEDATGREDSPIYCFDHAVARVKAAAEAVRSLPFPFLLTARAENFLHGNPDLDDTIRRLKAFADAGADVLYAPGLSSAEQRRASARGGAGRGAETGERADVRSVGPDGGTVERVGRQAHQRRLGAGPGRLWRVLPRRRGNPAAGHIHFHAPLDAVQAGQPIIQGLMPEAMSCGF